MASRINQEIEKLEKEKRAIRRRQIDIMEAAAKAREDERKQKERQEEICRLRKGKYNTYSYFG
jgi:mRNA-degrading endonuclease RelE of RelBE toxin-antitoxin system